MIFLMNPPNLQLPILDNGGARSKIDRRQNADAEYRPEKRTGGERRRRSDRRSSPGRERDRSRGAVERRDIFRKSC